jgi:hypothetical protein
MKQEIIFTIFYKKHFNIIAEWPSKTKNSPRPPNPDFFVSIIVGLNYAK